MLKRSTTSAYLRVKSQFNPAKFTKVTSRNNLVNFLSVLQANPVKTSCIYLIKTNKFKEEVLDIEDIYKFGYTNDLARRLVEHEKRYGFDIEVQLFAPVPEHFLKEAENEVKSYFALCNCLYPVKSYNELVKINEKDLPLVSKFYQSISQKYCKSFEVIAAENALLKKILKVE
jgi:hypothetical protein